jgi:geranylgeranylglycerol-phosphate geranylgeranyltransferase
MIRTRFIGLLRLFRIELPLSAGICVILGELLAAGSVPRNSHLLLGFLSFFFISATALILNDYFDYEIDRINAPDRPLPAGLVTKRDVVILSLVIALLGLISSALISMSALLIAFVVWIVGVAYNWRFKRTGIFGNLLVSFSVGMTFVFGGIVVGHPADIVVWWFGILAMLVDLGEEIASDAMDIEGDKLIGSRSLAILLGRQKALKISAAVFGAVVAVSLVPFLLHWLKTIYLIPILLLDCIIVYATRKLLKPNTIKPRIYVRLIYLGGSFAMLLLIAMRLVLKY